MVKTVGQVPGPEAAKAIRAGRIIHDTHTLTTPTEDGTPPTDPITGDEFAPQSPWLVPVGHALTRGMSMAAAEAIQRGLGTPTEDVPTALLRSAAEQLCVLASTIDPDLLFDRARRLRDELDAAGIGLREEERRQQRSFTLAHLATGMVKVVWLMDPETAATVEEIYDRGTSPRRGGPRHGIGTAAQAHADSIAADTRNTEQFASDLMRDILQTGAAADDSQLLGTGAPSIRILTTRKPRHTHPSTTSTTTAPTPDETTPPTASPAGSTRPTTQSLDPARDTEVVRLFPTADDFGSGWIEGQKDPVSPETVARLACDGSTCEIAFDDTGQPLDLGREQRLFDRKQRIVISARDGGCRAGNENGNGMCDRPPSWTEVHHVEQWKRDNGATNIANGILLCKHHHLELHNKGWEIHRDGSTYWLIPPITVDPTQTPRLMAARSPALDQLTRHIKETDAPSEEKDAPDSTGWPASANPSDTDPLASSG
jgi:hypothetical protein